MKRQVRIAVAIAISSLNLVVPRRLGNPNFGRELDEVPFLTVIPTLLVVHAICIELVWRLKESITGHNWTDGSAPFDS